MGKMRESRATKIVYMIGVLMKGFELGELENSVQMSKNDLLRKR
jgi:hypothetical protein